ncbi:MAG: hypothetical protein HY021_03590 [Burkholderiales bacterium]|nr:hypothetical protein [Burkholderiales bacterium]
MHWLAAHADWALPLPAECAAAVAMAAFSGWCTHPLVGHLRWDGQAWGWRPTVTDDGTALETVRAMIDLDVWMLLKADAAWCGLSRAEAGAAWHGLRVALYASRPAEERR